MICDSLGERDNRIRVIHKQNEGVSLARELGVNEANGEFIAFIDADDYIAKDYLKVLYDDMIKYQVDIACCDCVEIINGTRTNRFHNVLENRLIENKEQYVKDYVSRREFYSTVVWAKLIRKELLAEQKFKRIRFGSIWKICKSAN